MSKCHEEDRECNWLCSAYCGQELSYGSGAKGHCLKLAGPHMIAISINSFAKEVEELKDTLRTVEITLRDMHIEMV